VIGPFKYESGIDGVGEQVSCRSRAGFRPPVAPGIGFRRIISRLIQIKRAVVERLAKPSLFDQPLAKATAAIADSCTRPDLGPARRSAMASASARKWPAAFAPQHFSCLGGSNHNWCVQNICTAMSTTSMSGRATTAGQSVEISSHPQSDAAFPTSPECRPHTTFSLSS